MGRQYGFARVSQLLEVGLSRDQISRRIKRGTFERVERGIVHLAGAAGGRHAKAMRAVLIGGERAVACRWTAAELHGLEAPRHREAHVLTETARRQPSSDDVVFHRTRHLPARHIVRIASIPATSVPRTITDCSTELDAWSALAMLDSCSASPSLWRAIHATADALSNGRPGVRAIATATHPDGAQRLRSSLERRAAAALRARGLPPGEWNVTLYDAQGPIREVDLLYRESNLVVEIDGLRYHTQRDRARMDRATDRRLHLIGISVLRFVWRDVVHNPSGMATEVERAYAA
jgi:very-short-patch-repair endonuclease